MSDDPSMVIQLGRSTEDFRREALAGLLRDSKSISPKYLYDEKGSELFEQICELPEYYPTRSESLILRENADEIARELGQELVLIEPGSGSCRKVRLLLERLESPRMYIPMDISRESLADGVRALSREAPDLAIRAACGDYVRGLRPLQRILPESGPRAVFFPGSTIGNFEPQEAERFLSDCAELVGSGGAILLGFDLMKPVRVLEAAYDDVQGVTAAFNLNLLDRMNRELEAEFDRSLFRHRAVFDRILQRIEMHLVSQTEQKVAVAGRKILFREGESIHTESSYKYTVDSMRALGARSGLRMQKSWIDSLGLFCVSLFRVPDVNRRYPAAA